MFQSQSIQTERLSPFYRFRSSLLHPYSSSFHLHLIVVSSTIIFPFIIHSSLSIFSSSRGHLHNHLRFIFSHLRYHLLVIPQLIFTSSFIILISSLWSSLHHPSVISRTSSTILSKSNYNSSNYNSTIFFLINRQYMGNGGNLDARMLVIIYITEPCIMRHNALWDQGILYRKLVISLKLQCLHLWLKEDNYNNY